MFGIKDIFTTINLLGGVVGICLCIDGRPYGPASRVMLGYLLGDALDGYVARKLNSANQFGAEFDTIADHTSHVIAPAAIVYTVYQRRRPPARIRGTRSSRSRSRRRCDRGLDPPRAQHRRAGQLQGRVVRPAPLRARLHRDRLLQLDARGVRARWLVARRRADSRDGHRDAHVPAVSEPPHQASFFWYVWVVIVITFGITIAMVFVYPKFFFDVLFFFMAGYSLSSWMSLTPEERDRIPPQRRHDEVASVGLRL